MDKKRNVPPYYQVGDCDYDSHLSDGLHDIENPLETEKRVLEVFAEFRNDFREFRFYRLQREDKPAVLDYVPCDSSRNPRKRNGKNKTGKIPCEHIGEPRICDLAFVAASEEKSHYLGAARKYGL